MKIELRIKRRYVHTYVQSRHKSISINKYVPIINLDIKQALNILGQTKRLRSLLNVLLMRPPYGSAHLV